MLVPAASASAEGPAQVFAGSWSTFGGNGTLNLQVTDAPHGLPAFYYYSGGGICYATVWYEGTYTHGSDSGRLAGCSEDPQGLSLTAWYQSGAGQQQGKFSVNVSCDPNTFSGEYEERSTPPATKGPYLGTRTSAPLPNPCGSPPSNNPPSSSAAVSSGTATVRAKGTSTFIPLSSSTSIPDGSEIDATNGRVTITVASPNGGTVSAEVYGGRFRIHRDSGGETHFTLTLALTGCPRVALPRGSAAALAFSAKHRSGPKSRHLWVSETGGKWGTNGRFVSTSVKGTTWLTLDECTQSQVKVTAGKVKVRDLVRKKTKAVTAGKQYIAKSSARRK
jgi:hypothetical protein